MALESGLRFRQVLERRLVKLDHSTHLVRKRHGYQEFHCARLVFRAQDRFLRLCGQRKAVVSGGVSIEPILPELSQPEAAMNAAQGQHALVTWLAPEHARLLATGTDDGFAARFNDA